MHPPFGAGQSYSEALIHTLHTPELTPAVYKQLLEPGVILQQGSSLASGMPGKNGSASF